MALGAHSVIKTNMQKLQKNFYGIEENHASDELKNFEEKKCK